MRFFKVMLTLKNPSKKGESLDFRTKESDITHAQERFNEKFSKWNKRVFVIEISENRITLLLVKEIVEPGADITPLEIGKFSSILYRDKAWDKYSKEESKLFASVMFKEISGHEEIETELAALSQQTGIDEIIKEYEKETAKAASDKVKIQRDENYYKSKRSSGRDTEIESDSFNETKNREISDNVKNSEPDTCDKDEPCQGSLDDQGDDKISDISDETALKTLQLLIETQDIGRSSAEKKRIIAGVKKMLMHWLER
ncbi:MAG TPA: hypothetical protein PKK26_14070 [Candidatus Wallbacteria bacterium]|nr:hypothetical protein [Candidatus Wallbacteria bacterium]